MRNDLTRSHHWLLAFLVASVFCSHAGSTLLADEAAGDASSAKTQSRPPLASVYQQAPRAVTDKSTSVGDVARGSDAYHSLLRMQQYWSSDAGRQWVPLVGETPQPSTLSESSRRSTESGGLVTPSPRVVAPQSERESSPSSQPSPQTSQQPVPTSLGTARYIERYQAMRAGLNFLDAPTGVTFPSGIYAGGGYLSGAPVSNPHYPSYSTTLSTNPMAASPRPFDDIYSTSPATELYRHYWPLMLDRTEEGLFLLDAADVYWMTRDNF